MSTLKLIDEQSLRGKKCIQGCGKGSNFETKWLAEPGTNRVVVAGVVLSSTEPATLLLSSEPILYLKSTQTRGYSTQQICLSTEYLQFWSGFFYIVPKAK